MELKTGADPLAVQERYARWLAWGTRLALALLVFSFIAYVSGLWIAHVPVERMPGLWALPASELPGQTGIATGWSWAALVHRSDMLVLAAIALLASCSIPCLAASIPAFRARGERVFVAICVLEIGILALAASGVFAA